MGPELLAAYLVTTYRVRLPRGGWAAIHINAPLPAALEALVGNSPWSFITAWNPRSQVAEHECNHRAQRELLAALRALSETTAIHPGCGAGRDGWREPSLFVIGPDINQLDPLARHHRQNAYVHGQGTGSARLRQL